MLEFTLMEKDRNVYNFPVFCKPTVFVESEPIKMTATCICFYLEKPRTGKTVSDLCVLCTLPLDIQTNLDLNFRIIPLIDYFPFLFPRSVEYFPSCIKLFQLLD